MCLLIVLSGVDPAFPVIVAANRDEDRRRSGCPPGLFVGERRRMLAPRDRRAGGTWLAVNDRRLFAGITNLAGVPRPSGATTRGILPLLALDEDDLDGAAAAVARAVGEHTFDGFQLVLADADRTLVLGWDGRELRTHAGRGAAVVVSNEHRPGELVLPDLPAAAASGLPLAERLAALARILTDTGESSGHRVLKLGGDYGTVSSSLIAVPAAERDLRDLVWQFAPGPPDVTPYRRYGNLARRLIETGDEPPDRVW